MDALELLTTRASNGKLSEPEPDPETLAVAFQAAVRAPDHGQLRPFRFFTIRGAGREALGELMAAHLKDTQPGVPQEALEKARKKPLRAPLIIVVAARIQDHPKVPHVEQLVCAGVAAQNILLALYARGFAGIWRTGDAAYAGSVKRAFGLQEHDAIVGFLYVGTPAQATPQLKRPDPGDHVSEWVEPCTR